MSNKKDLYKKYVETFGVNQTLLDVIIKIGELGIAICDRFLSHPDPLQNTPLSFNDKFHEAFANAHIALDQVIEMMGIRDKQKFLTAKHYMLNQLERDIRDKGKENEKAKP
jgi:hypothetical protein